MLMVDEQHLPCVHLQKMYMSLQGASAWPPGCSSKSSTKMYWAHWVQGCRCHPRRGYRTLCASPPAATSLLAWLQPLAQMPAEKPRHSWSPRWCCCAHLEPRPLMPEPAVPGCVPRAPGSTSRACRKPGCVWQECGRLRWPGRRPQQQEPEDAVRTAPPMLGERTGSRSTRRSSSQPGGAGWRLPQRPLLLLGKSLHIRSQLMQPVLEPQGTCLHCGQHQSLLAQWS
mmetsp:Transcript_90148/g.291727  ORF Transcript_90148/g.291727 Transcript_90148/m.291727 type:complete len:227 (-) Transcript_90148:1390-2070(-)